MKFINAKTLSVCCIAIAASAVTGCKTLDGIDTFSDSGSSIKKLTDASAAAAASGSSSSSSTASSGSSTNIYKGGTTGRAHGVSIGNVASFSIAGRTRAGGSSATATRGDDDSTFADDSVVTTDIAAAPILGSPSSFAANAYVQGTSLIMSYVGTNGGLVGILDDSHYGMVYSETGSTGSVTAFHAGNPTTSMPTTGIGHYVGAFNGALLENGDNQSAGINGTTVMDADFAAGTLTGGVYGSIYEKGLVTPTGGPASVSLPYNLLVNGTISGTSVTGTVSYDTTDAGATVNSSSMSAGFYGDNARELTGAMRIEGSSDGISGAIVGSFGSIKQ